MKFDFLKNLFDGKQRVPKTDITRRFELIGRVGQGSMSRVWRARDTLSGKIVALKVLDKEKTLRFEARFAPELKKPSEGEVAVSLKNPHIVKTYEWGITQDGEQFLVMEFVDGLGLSYLVDVQNEVMRKNRLSFMIQLGDAIRYFHEQNWIHRDICPRNVMVTDADLQIKLIDFGLVVPNTPPFRAPGNRTGTANYMAPELIKRQPTDQRIDVFSFAVTCYEMFAKRFPWKAAESLDAVLQHINTPPHDIRETAPGIDEQVAAAIMKGLATNPKERWQTIAPMIYQFREAQDRLFPGKRKKTAAAGPLKEMRPQSRTKPAAKPTPGITLAEEGITLAEDQPEDLRRKRPAKTPAATPGITLAEEGISLADDQPPDARDKRASQPKAPTPGITLADEGITL
ncbi:MAG: serine/threonine protein kinase, partial [Deltaproteobacteria bacterium]